MWFSKLWGQKRLLLACFILMFVIYFFVSEFAQHVRYKRELQHWVPVSAEIISLHVKEYRRKQLSHIPDLTLSYDYLGQHFEQHAFATLTRGDDQAEAERSAKALYPIGKQVNVIVNPADPSDIRLYSDRDLPIQQFGLSWAFAFGMLLCLTLFQIFGRNRSQ